MKGIICTGYKLWEFIFGGIFGKFYYENFAKIMLEIIVQFIIDLYYWCCLTSYAIILGSYFGYETIC